MRPSPPSACALSCGYALLWTLRPAGRAALPLAPRAARTRSTAQHLAERFGRYPAPAARRRLGPCRLAGRDALRRPADPRAAGPGRNASSPPISPPPAGARPRRVFAADIAAGPPARRSGCRSNSTGPSAGFFRAFRPKYGLVMEIEIWPRMIFAARARGRAALHVQRAVSVENLSPATHAHPRPRRADAGLCRGLGEIRPAGATASPRSASRTSPSPASCASTSRSRPRRSPPDGPPAAGWAPETARVITFASVVEGEDALFLDAIAALARPIAPQAAPRPSSSTSPARPNALTRWPDCCRRRGLTIVRRSRRCSTPTFAPVRARRPPIDVLLGDSLGEMYFYLAMSDRVVVGGGFTPKGSHNIIEPLALANPVMSAPRSTPSNTRRSRPSPPASAAG